MKNICSVFTLICVIFFSFQTFVSAGTLSCTIRSGSCNAGEAVVLKMHNTTNSHAELPSQSNYSNLLCCGGVTGISNSCSGTYATVLKVYSATNSHVEVNTQSLYTNSACLAVPSGGSVTIAYQDNNCTGYDTTLASISGVTNAHIAGTTTYTKKICGTASGATGLLSVDFVDGSGVSISSPTLSLSNASAGFSYSTTTGTLGTSSQKIRVTNTTANTNWSLTISATSGNTALWTNGSSFYDYNDPTANAQDGADSDNYGGQMTLNPSVSTITPQSGCTASGISKGNQNSFSQGILDSLSLSTSNSSTPTNCYWDFTGITVSQTIPKQQATGTYTINMTATVAAY